MAIDYILGIRFQSLASVTDGLYADSINGLRFKFSEFVSDLLNFVAFCRCNS